MGRVEVRGNQRTGKRRRREIMGKGRLRNQKEEKGDESDGEGSRDGEER